MFESISKRFQDITKRFFSSGYITEKNIEEGIREVRKALLDADANFGVVKAFIARVKEKAIGEELIKSVSPAQQFIKIVSEELTALMGPVDHSIQTGKKPPTVIMMVGLQGSGKTTTCGKLARYLTAKKHKPLLVAADIQRPGAVEQLQTLGEKLDVPVFAEPKWAPPKICSKGVAQAAKNGNDIVILDTAGRLHIDEELMKELREIQRLTKPHNIFLVTDAMTGQDAAKSAKEFNDQLEISGVILTKLDGDAKGGAALSIKEVTGKPIKFIGVGEKLDRLEEFHPDRMADRILGMGDIVTLVERAEEFVTKEKAEEMQQKLLENSFTLEDFLDQFKMIKKMGSIQDLLGMLPGGLGAQMQNMPIDERDMNRTEAIILSMTPEERKFPDIINGSRRKRIADGSGNTVQDVNMLLKQFGEMKAMMGNMGKMGSMMNKMASGMAGLGGGLGLGGMGGGLGGFSRRRSTKKKKPKVKRKKK